MQCGALARARYSRTSRTASSTHQMLEKYARSVPKLFSLNAATTGAQDAPLQYCPSWKRPPIAGGVTLPKR